MLYSVLGSQLQVEGSLYTQQDAGQSYFGDRQPYPGWLLESQIAELLHYQRVFDHEETLHQHSLSKLKQKRQPAALSRKLKSEALPRFELGSQESKS